MDTSKHMGIIMKRTRKENSTRRPGPAPNLPSVLPELVILGVSSESHALTAGSSFGLIPPNKARLRSGQQDHA